MAAAAFGQTNAQTVFTDAYNRASFGTTGGTPTATYALTSGSVTMTGGSGAFAAGYNSTAAADALYCSAAVSVFSSPFTATLGNNNSILTWTVNMRTNTAVTSLPSATAVSGAVDLMGNAANNIFSGSPSGYAVMFNPGSNGGIELVKFTSGMAAGGCTVLIAPSSSMSKTNYYSVRVTYEPATNLWSLYLRDDGSSGFSDPASGVTTLIGTATDNTYTGSALTRFGYMYGFNAGTGKSMLFDNYTLSVGPAINYTTLTSPVCSTGDRTFSATVTYSATSGGNLPRVYYRKNSGSWVSSAGTFSSGTTYNFTISASAMGGLTNGDIVSYYVAAQDLSSYAVVYAKPYVGLVASSVTSISTPPTTPNTYAVGSPSVSPTVTPNPACLGVTMTLNSGSSGGNTYSWNGPSGYTSTLQNPSFTAAAGSSGVYTVSATNSCGTATATTASVSAVAAPTITVTPTTATVCPGSFRRLTASGGSTYTWAPTSGLSATSGASVTANPTVTTTYTVTGSNGTCINVATAALTLGTTPFVVTAVATPSITCNGGSATLTATPQTSMYNTVTSIPYALVTQTSPTSIPNAAWTGSNDDGYLTVSLPFTFNFYGVNYTSVNIGTNGFVNFGTATTDLTSWSLPNTSAPRAMIALFETDMVCPSNAVKYSTEGTAPNRKFVIYYNGIHEFTGGGNNNFGQIVLYETSGMVDVIVTGTYSGTKTCGVQNAAGTAAVTVPGENSAAYTVATGEAWRFTGVPTTTYSWSPATALSATTAMSPFASPVTSTTTYSVVATDSATGCTATANTTVTVGTLPGTISGTTAICSGASTNITFSGPVSDTAVYTVNGGAPQTAVIGVGGTVIISTGALTTATTYELIAIRSSPCNQAITGQTAVVSINPSAGPITATSPLCTASSATFTDAVGGGTWSSSATGIATVSSSGVVTGVAAGTATISYVVGSCPAATTTVVINTAPVAITPATAVSVCETATTTLADASSGGVWSSSDTTLATVNAATGVVTGVLAGSVTITYANGCGSPVSKSVTVNTMPAPITGISYGFAPAAVCTLAVYNSFTNSVSGGTWSNTPTTVGTVNSSTGIFTATTTTGTTVLTYAIGTCSVTASLNVGSTSPAAITGTTTVCATATTTLADATPSGVWTSSNISVATVAPSTGVVRGVNSGSVTITYDNGCGTPATTTVTVNGSTPVLTTDTMCSGGTLHLNAALAAAGAYSWTGPNAFSSTLQNPTISSVTADAAGTYSFSTTSTVGSCTSVSQVFAIVDQLPSVTVTASPGTICAGETSALNANLLSPTSYTVYAIPYSPLTVTTGTNGPNGDDAQTNVTLPFTFNYLGTNFSNVHICTNGFINFGGANTDYTPVALPSTGTAQGMIALFWHDLTATAGQIKYTTFGSAPNRKFVVNYNAVADLSGAGTNTGQVILYETSNVIDVFVAKSNVGAATNVCGIQNNARNFALNPPGENATSFTVTGPGEGWRFVTPSYIYNWGPSTGLSSTTIANPTSAATTTQVYTVTTTDIYSSCAGNVTTQTVNVNPMPVLYNVTGGGSYCGITPLSIGLSNSNPSVSYQLKRGTTSVGSPVTGSTGAFSFGTFTTPGTYFVQATGSGGCIDTMTGTAVITNYTVDITVGANPSVCQPTSSATLSYSSPTGSPTTYDITWDAAALTAGFSNVSTASLGATISLVIPSGSAGTFTGSLTVSNGSCTSVPHTISVTVYAHPNGSITSAVAPCSGYSTNIVFSGTTGQTLAYKIDGGSILTATLTGGTYTLSTGALTSTHTYTLYDVHNPVCSTVIDSTISINPIAMQWAGGTTGLETDWNTAANWACGFVPGSSDDVIVPSGTTYAPAIAASSAGTSRNLNIASGATVAIGTGATLNIKGNLTTSGLFIGTGLVTMNGTSPQTISGITSVNNFDVNNSTGITVVPSSKLTIKSVLTVASGTFNTGDSVVLYSDSVATARVGQLPTSGSVISGNIKVMQYIQGGMRRYRFWSHPFSNYIGLNQIGRNIDVTGPGGVSNGFTNTSSNAPSVFRYNPLASNSGLASDPGWKPITNAGVSADSNRLHRYQGVRVFFRGSKGQGLGYETYVPAPVTVMQEGLVNQGNQTVVLSKGSSANQDYNMVGNPYPSPVDIGTVIYNAKVAGNIAGSAYYIWNPTLGAAGQFQAMSISTVSAAPYYIQANCAFQVRAAHNNDSLNFAESNKSSTATTVLFKNQPGYTSLMVYDENYHPWDMLQLQFNDASVAEDDNVNDAAKLSASDFGFYSLSTDNKKLAIDVRPYQTEQVIPLGIHSDYSRNFIIKAGSVVVPNDGALYLHDKLLKQYIQLHEGTEYRFAINGDKATQGENRFELSMQPKNGALSKVSKGLEMSMAPNPTTGDVNISFVNGKNEAVSMRIVDISGVTVYEQNLGTREEGSVNVSLSRMAAGVYMVELTAGDQKTIQRLVKE